MYILTEFYKEVVFTLCIRHAAAASLQIFFTIKNVNGSAKEEN